jgi:RND family efflux transporter MFP subunit
VLAGVLVLAAIIIFAVSNMTKQVEVANNVVEVEPVKARDLSDTLSVKGTVAGVSSTNVTSKAVAEITSVNVQVGDIVSAGDVLCTIDSASIQDQITELEKTMSNSSSISSINKQQNLTALEQAKADQQTQLEAAQTALDRAELNYYIANIHYNAGETTTEQMIAEQEAVEDAKKNLESVQVSTDRAVKSAEIAVELDQYQDSDSSSKDTLKNLKEQLADCEVIAPCSGVVTAVNVRVGDINADKTTILTIEDTSTLKMVATVSEADILKLKEGMKATITADATGDEVIDGEVTRVVRVKQSGSAGTDGSSDGYSVEISVNNKELLIGMSVKAKVMINETGSVLAVPYDLIRYDDEGNAYVLVAENYGGNTATAVRRDVTVGDEVDYYTQITGGDLSEGEMLIYDYSYTINEGDEFSPEQLYSEQDLSGGYEPEVE